jgi:hypothetical protein
VIKFKQVLLAAAVLSACATASAANLVDNGGFESGNFAGWSLAGNTGYTGVGTVGVFGIAPTEGSFLAYFGAIGSDTVMTQSLAVTSSSHYTVSFDLADDGASSGQDFSASFGGTSLLSLNSLSSSFTHYSFDVLGGTGVLQFGARNDPNYWLLDNVSVTQSTAAVPEAASSTMLMAGIALLGFAALRRRSAR